MLEIPMIFQRTRGWVWHAGAALLFWSIWHQEAACPLPTWPDQPPVRQKNKCCTKQHIVQGQINKFVPGQMCLRLHKSKVPSKQRENLSNIAVSVLSCILPADSILLSSCFSRFQALIVSTFWQLFGMHCYDAPLASSKPFLIDIILKEQQCQIPGFERYRSADK